MHDYTKNRTCSVRYQTKLNALIELAHAHNFKLWLSGFSIKTDCHPMAHTRFHVVVVAILIFLALFMRSLFNCGYGNNFWCDKKKCSILIRLYLEWTLASLVSVNEHLHLWSVSQWLLRGNVVLDLIQQRLNDEVCVSALCMQLQYDAVQFILYNNERFQFLSGAFTRWQTMTTVNDKHTAQHKPPSRPLMTYKRYMYKYIDANI